MAELPDSSRSAEVAPGNRPGRVRIASVVPDRAGEKVLDYRVPDELSAHVAIGSRVRIPVRKRELNGTVVNVREDEPAFPLRPLLALHGEKPLLPARLLELARWMAEYYCSPLDVAVASVLPQAVRSGEVAAKRVAHVALNRQPSAEDIALLEKRAPRQAEALRHLVRLENCAPLQAVAKASGASPAVLRSLAASGWLRIEQQEIGRDPHGSETFLPTRDLPLNPAQRSALEVIVEMMRGAQPSKPVLLHGVTGSGKTEVYLQAIREALADGRQALVLVPEISLTPQTVERFKARFAGIQRQIAVLHSHLSAGERRDEWHKIHRGEAQVVIGARSAVFAPLTRLGILIVDEEHEHSYKQEESPRYHARDVAVLRGRMEPCAVVLGSATPSLESYANALHGKYLRVELPERVDNRRMPILRVVDMRRERRSGHEIFSQALLRGIEERLSRKEQTILFLNRRGYSTVMQCAECGEVIECPNCSIALTYHRDAQRLACHICGYGQVAPRACPACHDPKIRFSGVGTQKVEDAICRLFPQARVARMDADAMSRKDAYKNTLGAFQKGAVDILVGTQMIAKGLDFPNVTLVGIINADLGLHLPDFRAGERTFQLLTQVAGRAGRGEIEGEVIVQTFTPFSPSIQFARQHDYPGFAEQELDFRSKFAYPPYTRMILITLRSKSAERAEFCARTLARKLRENLPEGAICGEAAPAPLAKAKAFFRFQVMLRGPGARTLSRHVQHVLEALPMPEDVMVAVDVDPVNLL